MREDNNNYSTQSNSSNKQRQSALATIVAISLLVGVIGFAAGRWSMVHQHPMLGEQAFLNLDRTYTRILESYQGEPLPDANDLLHGAAKGMVEALGDPYSAYYPLEEGVGFVARYEDQFVGIGLEVRVENGDYIVSSTIVGAPAEAAGVLPEDRLLQVDGQAVRGLSMAELIRLTRGEAGTTVTLTLGREGLNEPLEVMVTRAAVPVRTVSHERLTDDTGYIRITNFAENTDEAFKEALSALQEEGIRGLLLDVRSNPGGLLQQTTRIASLFVPANETILEVRYRDRARTTVHRSSQEAEWTLPIVVLIDERSASAAEVLAAALRDRAGAELIGQPTFGKGVVQSFRQFSDQSVLKLTEAEWLTPDGERINGQGLTPDLTVAQPAYASLPALSSGIQLTLGSYGQNVRTARELLLVLGYAPGEAAGVYTEELAAAVAAFQRDQGLDADGVLEDATAYRMMEALRTKLQQEDPQRTAGLVRLQERIALQAEE